MIVDAATAKAINSRTSIVPGGWATFDDIETVAIDMRQRIAITSKFKPASDGPFFVVEMEVTQPVKSNIGFVGRQTETNGSMLRGGGTQIQFDETIEGLDRNSFLRISSSPKSLK